MLSHFSILTEMSNYGYENYLCIYILDGQSNWSVHGSRSVNWSVHLSRLVGWFILVWQSVGLSICVYLSFGQRVHIFCVGWFVSWLAHLFVCGGSNYLSPYLSIGGLVCRLIYFYRYSLFILATALLC